MTETNASTNASPQPAATARLPPNQPFTPYEAQKAPQRARTALLWFVVVILAFAAGVGGYALNRKLERTEQQLAQRLQANDTKTTELRIKTEQALVRRCVSPTTQVVATAKASWPTRRPRSRRCSSSTQDLARNRDDWTLAEVGSDALGREPAACS